MIGRIERVPLKEVWKHEALDFTTWLEENIDILEEITGLNVSGVEREKSAGPFSVDLVAEDGDGNPVVIENQLEKTNHDLLGKLITYLTSLEAKKAIWIASDPRPEHINAVTWLNESNSADFYLLKLEAIRIGDSAPAPLLTLIVGPSEEGREVGKKKKEIAEQSGIRKKFWTELLDRAKPRTTLHSRISPSENSWIGTGAGITGLEFNYVITKHAATVELYIDRGKEAGEENKAIFLQLLNVKQEIEDAFGSSLKWQELEGRRACRIKKSIDAGGYRDEEGKWASIHDVMIDAMIRLEKALAPQLKKLQI